MPTATSALALEQLSDALTHMVVRAAPSVLALHSARCSGFIWRPGLSAPWEGSCREHQVTILSTLVIGPLGKE